jgi:hypothetical protein
MASKAALLEQAEGKLGQRPLAAVKGNCEIRALGGLMWNGSRSGLLVATDTGVAFYAPRLGGFELQSYPYADITGMATGHSVASGGKVSIDTAAGGMKVTGIRDDDLESFVQLVSTRVSPDSA